MSNFEFARASLPSAPADGGVVPLERSRAACFYSRRAVERLVGNLHDVIVLPEPHQYDLAAHINNAAFKAKVGVEVAQKLNRKSPISPSTRWRS